MHYVACRVRRLTVQQKNTTSHRSSSLERSAVDARPHVDVRSFKTPGPPEPTFEPSNQFHGPSPSKSEKTLLVHSLEPLIIRMSLPFTESGHCPNFTALKALVHLRLQGCEHGASMTYAAMSSSTLRLMFVGLMGNPAPLKDTDMESCEVPEVKWERLQDHGCLAQSLH